MAVNVVRINGVMSSVPGQLSEINVKQFRGGNVGVLEYLLEGAVNTEYRDRTLKDLATFKIPYINAACDGIPYSNSEYDITALLRYYNVDFNIFTQGTTEQKQADKAYMEFATDSSDSSWVIWLFRPSFRLVSYSQSKSTKNYMERAGDLLVESNSSVFSITPKYEKVRLNKNEHKIAIAYINYVNRSTLLFGADIGEFSVRERLENPASSINVALIVQQTGTLGVTKTYAVTQGRRNYEFKLVDEHLEQDIFLDTLLADLCEKFTEKENYIRIYNILSNLRPLFFDKTGALHVVDIISKSRVAVSGYVAEYYTRKKMEELIKKYKETSEKERKKRNAKALEWFFKSNKIDWSE